MVTYPSSPGFLERVKRHTCRSPFQGDALLWPIPRAKALAVLSDHFMVKEPVS